MKTDIRVEKAGIQNVLALDHLLTQLSYESPYMPYNRPIFKERLLIQILSDLRDRESHKRFQFKMWCGCVYVLKTGVDTIGYIALERAAQINRNVHFHMGIRKEYWGLGLGTLLLSTAIETLHQYEMGVLKSRVDKSNHAAIALYKKFGFNIGNKTFHKMQDIKLCL